MQLISDFQDVLRNASKIFCGPEHFLSGEHSVVRHSDFVEDPKALLLRLGLSPPDLGVTDFVVETQLASRDQ